MIDRYQEGRDLADSYMRGRSTMTITRTIRRRAAEMPTSYEEAELRRGYRERIGEISRMPLSEIDALVQS